MNHGVASWSPDGAICAKCNLTIQNNQGRRFRMKWYHEHCLPDTRKAHLTKRRENEDGTPAPKDSNISVGLTVEQLEKLQKKLEQMKNSMR
jgi:hypothetical protein